MGAQKANGFLPVQNGFVNSIHLGSSCLVSRQRTFLNLFYHTLKSLIPFLLFIGVYSLNKVLHILPLAEDLGCVHSHAIDAIEGFVFGCHPHRLISAHHHVILDFLSAMPYLLHYFIPFLFPIYLLLKGNYDNIPKFYWLLGWVMWMHYFVWAIFPYTPPWVLDNIEKFNSTSPAIALTHREGCAFSRLDKLTGLPFFFKMFNGNPVLFASFPSGHVAWAQAIHSIGGPGGNRFVIYVLWVAWATLYSCHHYVSDAIGGLLVVIVTQKIVNYLAQKQVCSSDFKCRPCVVACPFHV